MELSAPERLKYPNKLIIEKMVFPPFHGCSLSDLFILKVNRNMHLSLGEFEFRPCLTTDYRVSCT